MGLERPERMPLSETVAAQLRRAIQDGEYARGAKLPTEAELSAILGVGRTTIREAIRALISEGMLTSRQGSGVYATGHVPLSQRLTTAALVEVFHARCAIETYAAELACAHRGDDDIVSLEQALEHRDRIPARTEEFARRDIAFHRAIVAASRNDILLDMFTVLEPRLIDAFVETRFLDHADSHQTREHVEAHYEIVHAIRDRDATRAAHLTRLLQAGTITLLESAVDSALTGPS